MLYDFQIHGKRAGPEAFLKDYHSYLQCDAHSVYDGIFAPADAARPAPTEVGCWAHARRKFYDAREVNPEAFDVLTCTVGVTLFYSCVLVVCVSLSSNDRSTPVPGVMYVVQDSNPSSVDIVEYNADATVHSTQVHTLAPSMTDFFLARNVSFVKNNAANKDNVTW